MVPLQKKIWRNDVLEWVLDLLYPPKCPFCQHILDEPRSPLCRSCMTKLPWLQGAHSQRKIDFAEGCVSPLRYEGAVREAIHRYKFSNIAAYGQPLGILMAQCVQDHPEIQVDMVTWTPLSRKRRWERGFDQAELLANSLGHELGLPVQGTLKKVRHTSRQSTLEEESQRRANVRGAYALRKHTQVKGKHILLVDDVVTSGATLEECAAMLRLAGAERIWCVVLAQAGKKDGKNS